MNTVETLCDSIFMIFRGAKVLDGALADIQEQYGNDTIRIKAERGAAVMTGLPASNRSAISDSFRNSAWRAAPIPSPSSPN